MQLSGQHAFVATDESPILLRPSWRWLQSFSKTMTLMSLPQIRSTSCSSEAVPGTSEAGDPFKFNELGSDPGVPGKLSERFRIPCLISTTNKCRSRRSGK